MSTCHFAINEVNFLERFKEQLAIKWVHWALDSANLPDFEQRRRVVADFIHWLRDDADNDLHCKRGNGLSFAESALMEANK